MPSRVTPAEALAIMTRLLRDLAQDHANQPQVCVQLYAAAEHVATAAHCVADAEAARVIVEVAGLDCPPQRGI